MEFFNHDPVKTLQFRDRIRNSFHQFLEQPEASRPLLVTYTDDWHTFVRDEFEKMTEDQRKKFLYHPSSTPDIFAHDHLPEYYLNSRTPGNHIYGLDPKALAKDKNYIGKTVSGVLMHYMNEANKTANPTVYGNRLLHESQMVFMVEDPSLVEAAKKMGAQVKEVSSTKRSRSMGGTEVKQLVSKGYELIFSPEVVKLIGSHYYHFNAIPELKTGITQLQYNRMHGL